MGIVIGEVTALLHVGNDGGDVSDGLRKAGRDIGSGRPAGGRMIKRAIALAPGLAAFGISLASQSADQQIGGRIGQTMEQSLVCRADCAAQIRLPGLATANADKIPCRFDQIKRLQRGVPDTQTS